MALTVNTNIINDTNQYLLDAKNVKGTFVVVASTAERDALPAATTVNGSLCYCTADSKFYQYNGSSWQEKEFGTNTTNDAYNLGYYDTITKNSDGTYTITRQTGYLTINTEDITRGSNETVNSAHAYVYAYSSKKVSDALYDWDAIIGISNNGFEVKCVDSDWIGANKISINSTANQICIGFSSPKTQAEIQALCPIYIQYKLATATTEIVEKNHYARYNQKFILEHNRTEAGEAVNLFDLSNVTDDSNYVNPEVIFSYENGGMIIPCGAETNSNNVSLQKFKNNGYISYLGGGEFAEGFSSITFQKTSDFNQIRIKRNGSKKDYGVLFNVDYLEDGKTYTISADVQLRNNTADRNIYCFHIMIVEGTIAQKEYYHYNAKKRISNNEALFLKNEAERSANLWDEITESGTLSGDDGSLENNSSRLRSKNFIPILPNTRYIFNSSYVARINFYGSTFNFISTWVNNKTPFVTPSNAYFIKFDINSDYGTTYKNDIILNEGFEPLPYQPYEGKVIHEKDLKNASTTLGYYDKITENPDESYTITKQTGYINGTDFLNWGVNAAGNRYVTFDHIKINRNIENVIGNCGRVGPDSWWQSTFTQVTITYDGNNDFLIILLPYGTAENDSSPLNDIHVQYKLPNARAEIVEKNYCAQYNKRFILEHNKIEAEKSSNLWSYENSITINAGSEKWWYLSNETMSNWGLVVGETYSIKSFVNNDTRNLAFQLLPSYSDFKEGRTFVFTSDTQIRIGGNTVSSTVTFTPKIMLVKGIDIADEYQPYSGKPVHKKEFEDFKNSMKFIPYVSVVETSSSKNISENGIYFVIPTEPFSASLKLEVRAGVSGTLQTAYFSGGIISVSSFFDSKLKFFEIRITYGAGSSAASISIADGHNYTSPPSGVISKITGKCKIYKLI